MSGVWGPPALAMPGKDGILMRLHQLLELNVPCFVLLSSDRKLCSDHVNAATAAALLEDPER